MLQETVEVWDMEAPQPHQVGTGVLIRGRDGLPSFCTASPNVIEYTPATLPAAWSLRAPRNTWPGVLLEAWNKIEQIRGDIAFAERLEEARAEEEERDQEQQRETENRIAEELERQRGEAGR